MLLLLQALVFHTPAAGSIPSGLSLLPIEPRLVVNSSRPWGINDGALWAGKGLSGSLALGARFRAGPLTVTLAPLAWFSGNAAFDTVSHSIANRHPLAFPWNNRIDLPQRFGEEAVTRLSPGQSSVRLHWRTVTVGFGTESMRWGPARRHPILMGTNAEGFPHLDLGVTPATTFAGQVEARVLWGRLTESAFFDTIPDNDGRMMAGLVFGWRPAFLPGLTVGFQRVFYQTWTDSLTASDFLSIVQPFTKDALSDTTDPEGNDIRDQMLSLTWRWQLDGFEVYGEWARNDHNRNWRDFILEPDHAQGWMLGMERVLPSGVGEVRLSGEFLHLGKSTTRRVRANPTFYTHHIVRQGYTNRGQVLGAGPGPGSDAQYAALDRTHAGGSWGLWLERTRWFNDLYYDLFGATRLREGHNVTLEFGGRYERRLGRATAELRASLVREWNRHFRIGNDAWNFNTTVVVRWVP